MSVLVSSVFMLSYVGSDLATGLISRSCKFQINSEGKQARGRK
jgi:hypothetical protein